ncbi:MAG TPA: FHA domain-containing protein [Pyrinomonadaceae bacterium]
MITCDRCQTDNIEGSQYCDECGAALSATGPAGRRHVTEESAAAEPEPLTADSGPARRAPAELRPAVKPHAFAASAAGRVRGHDDSAPRRDPAAAPHAKLVIHRGRSVGKEFPMCEDESHIGRWDADGGIFPDVDLDSDDPEAKVSRRHARITRRGGVYYIEDLGSTNGTFVNRGRRLLPGDRQPLRDGDEVIVGKTFLKFHVLNS